MTSKSKTQVYEVHCALCHSPLPILHTLFLVLLPIKLGRHTSTLGDLESYANRPGSWTDICCSLATKGWARTSWPIDFWAFCGWNANTSSYIEIPRFNH